MALPPVSRFFRPKTCLHFISLLTATEFITLVLLINKVEGAYGILALFTGFHLSALQLSMYMWSIVVFGLVCYLGPYIRKQSPLHNLALAWIFILDTIINAIYTTLFGLGWFITLARHLNPATGDDAPLTPPGGQTINETAGFTDPESKVEKVEVITTPRPDKMPSAQDAVAHGVANPDGTLGHAVFERGSIMSITVISTLWFIRLYFVVIVMSYARGVLRRAMAQQRTTASAKTLAPDSLNPSRANSPSMPQLEQTDRNPFSATRPAGQGWSGRLGRFLVRYPRSYWLGRDEAEESWIRGADERFRARSVARGGRGSLLRNPPPPTKGTGERERRARSGTGPPPPGLNVSPSIGRPSGEEQKRSGEY